MIGSLVASFPRRPFLSLVYVEELLAGEQVMKGMLSSIFLDGLDRWAFLVMVE